MNAKEPTKRELLLRERALKVTHRSLPDQIGKAYDVEGPVEERDAARAIIVARGHLSEDELTSLPVEEAIKLAQQRLRDQIESLQYQAETLARLEKGNRERRTMAPRTLRQG